MVGALDAIPVRNGETSFRNITNWSHSSAMALGLNASYGGARRLGTV